MKYVYVYMDGQDLLVVHMAVDRIIHQYNTISPNYGGDDCDGNGDKT